MTERIYAVVVWRDAHAATETWTHIDDIDKNDYLVTSVGFLLENAKHGHLVLAQSSIDSENIYDHVLAIPAGMVVSVKHIAP